jgi:hypothetical protein
MPIPTASCAEDIPDNVCCDTTWMIGDRIRTVAWAGLQSCDKGCSERTFRSYTTIGSRIEEPLGESLVVAMTDLDVRPDASGQTGMFLVHVATYRVELRENGWPMVEHDESENIIFVPDSRMINALSRHVQSHGEKVWRAVTDGVARQTLFRPGRNPHVYSTTVTTMRPIGPEAFQAGWGFGVRVEMSLP